VSREAFERKLDALEALRSAPDAARLRKALADRNNYYVSKAAAIVAEQSRKDLIPDLLAAFERFLSDAVKSDPKCWAKIAIAKALRDLEHDDPAVFLQGIGHVQWEPVWGGREDSAAPLRGICGLALTGCRLPDFELLTRLVDLLADPAKPARIDAVRAVAQSGCPEGALLLRLKALSGDEDAAVTGECFAALVSLAGSDAVAFVARFLRGPDEDVKMEAVSALALAKEPEALDILKAHWRERLTPEMRRSLLLSLAGSPVAAVAEFLLSVVADESGDLAAAAISALAASRFREESRERLASVIADKNDPEAGRAFAREYGPS
jgi:HEAT repeat protein